MMLNKTEIVKLNHINKFCSHGGMALIFMNEILLIFKVHYKH